MKVRVCNTKPKGFALAVTLIIFAVLFVLSAAYLSSIEYDARFTKLQQAGIQAIYLAQSGVQYYKDKSIDRNGNVTVIPLPVEISVDNNKIIIEYYPGKSNYLKITGIVYGAPDNEIARQTITAPIGRWDEWHRM